VRKFTEWKRTPSVSPRFVTFTLKTGGFWKVPTFAKFCFVSFHTVLFFKNGMSLGLPAGGQTPGGRKVGRGLAACRAYRYDPITTRETLLIFRVWHGKFLTPAHRGLPGLFTMKSPQANPYGVWEKDVMKFWVKTNLTSNNNNDFTLSSKRKKLRWERWYVQRLGKW
jgi:hypothetical protein